MINSEEIKIKAAKKYTTFLQSLVEENSFSNVVIRGNKSYTKSSLFEFEKEMNAIIGQSKERKGFGYSLDFQQVKTKYLGRQDLPVGIYFDSEKDFLKYLGKEKEVVLFKENCELIISQFRELKNWIIKSPLKVIQHQNEWENLLLVCTYFKAHPPTPLYIRELPIKVHTKFIEQHKGILRSLLDELLPDTINSEAKIFEKRFHLKSKEPLVRFRVLDSEISQSYFSGLDDMAIPLSQFEALQLPLKRVLVVENKTTLYTTLTLPAMQKSIAIFGSGYSVNNLKNANWLADTELLYWGDIDAQGFEILSQFRNYFPNVSSVLMDKATFDQFFENDLGTPSSVSTSLNLSVKEQELYALLKEHNWRLEQEKVEWEYVNEWFLNFESFANMSNKQKIQIYHNASCSKSNASCQLLTKEGIDFEIIEYLKTPLTKEDLIALLRKLDIPASDLVRKGEAEFKENYFGKALSEKEWIDAMLKFPNLIQRPIVVQGDKAVIGRPIERVVDLIRK